MIGRTGVGPAAFTDTMHITEWDPPRRCTVTHSGPIVRGEGIFEVRPLGPGRSEFRWTERIVLPAPVAELIPARAEAVVTRLAYAVLGPLARIGLGSSLVRFARLAARAAEEPRERMLRSTAVTPTTELADAGLPDAGAWALDPAFAHLNHGGFGATPVCVLAAHGDGCACRHSRTTPWPTTSGWPLPSRSRHPAGRA